MNKKFSTLVASLLLSSAFSVYAGNAKPMLATPTQVETRATSADVEDAVEWTGAEIKAITSEYANQVLPGFTNNARLLGVRAGNSSDLTATNYFVKFDAASGVNQPVYDSYPSTVNKTTEVDNFYWSLIDNQLVDNAGHVFSADGSYTYMEVIPVKSSDANAPTYYFVLGTRVEGGKLKYVAYNASASYRYGLVDKLEDALLFCSVETEYNLSKTGTDVNGVLGNGFNLFVSSKVKEDVAIVDEDVFEGAVIKANEEQSPYYQLVKGNKFIVFDTNEKITSDGYAEEGKFKLVDKVSDANAQWSYFQISKADNGSDDFILRAFPKSNGPASGKIPYRLYIANAAGTFTLSLAAENGKSNVVDWAATSFDGGNIVDLREFLTGQYYTIDYVKKNGTATADDTYKTGGRLAILNDKVDYVPAKGLYEKAPEAQWAVSGTVTEGVNEGKPYFDDEITLTNRENPSVSFRITQLRRDNGAFIATIADETPTDNTGIDTNDVIKITAVENHDKHDGYKVFNDEELKNTTWYLGQVRRAEATDSDLNVYWTENHTSEGTHQIGATVDEANATKWNLAYVTKNTVKADYNNQKDSILIVSTLQDWNDKKNRIDSKQDTLVIFPYSFQNRSNGEFVEFNNAVNLKYYQCREYTTAEESVFDKSTYNENTKEWSKGDARFALKLKANAEDGSETYNYVTLTARNHDSYDPTTADVNANVKAVTNASYASNKVYQHNSANLGTWKDMGMYQEDANSIMFVKKVDAPEYRKLVAENGIDSVTIHRAENTADVVYEKKDPKSVVEGDTLSFLDIDNAIQFKEINSALYVDTAYVNREGNSRYLYLLGVNVTEHSGYYCEDHGFTPTPACKHAVPVRYKTGRYLVNMMDTAITKALDLKVSIHNNPYINETTEGNVCAKLAFVDAIHVLTDSVNMDKADKLYIKNGATDKADYDVLSWANGAMNPATFAFKYVDSLNGDDFKIQTQYRPYDLANYGKSTYVTTEEGYLRWVNSCLVVDDNYAKGEVFNMNEDETRTPTANEEIATSSVVVAGVNGAVVVKGAEGKNVIVSTILGKVVANEVVSSDNATIAAPQGVVVVSVDGESFKVVVK